MKQLKLFLFFLLSTNVSLTFSMSFTSFLAVATQIKQLHMNNPLKVKPKTAGKLYFTHFYQLADEKKFDEIQEIYNGNNPKKVIKFNTKKNNIHRELTQINSKRKNQDKKNMETAISEVIGSYSAQQNILPKKRHRNVDLGLFSASFIFGSFLLYNTINEYYLNTPIDPLTNKPMQYSLYSIIKSILFQGSLWGVGIWRGIIGWNYYPKKRTDLQCKIKALKNILHPQEKKNDQ